MQVMDKHTLYYTVCVRGETVLLCYFNMIASNGIQNKIICFKTSL